MAVRYTGPEELKYQPTCMVRPSCSADVTDRKFAVKARLYQALGVTVAVVRSYLHSPKILQSLVAVLKLYATDGQSTYRHLSVLICFHVYCMNQYCCIQLHCCLIITRTQC